MSTMGPTSPGKNDGRIPAGVPSPKSSKKAEEGKTSEVFQGALKGDVPPDEGVFSTSAFLQEGNRFGLKIQLRKIIVDDDKPFVSENRVQSLAFEREVLGTGCGFVDPRSPPEGASPWLLDICRFFRELPKLGEACASSGELSKEDSTDLFDSHSLDELAALNSSDSVVDEFAIELDIGPQQDSKAIDLQKHSNLKPDPDSIARDITPTKEKGLSALIPIRSGDFAAEGIRQGVTNTFIARSDAGENLAVIKPALGVFRYGLNSDWHTLPVHRGGIQYSDMVGRERLAFVISNLLSKIWSKMSVSVPETQLMQIPVKFFSGRFVDCLLPEDTLISSVQQFIPSTNLALCSKETVSSIDSKKIRSLAVLDILVYNADRGRYNTLLSGEFGDLVPIDHGLILSRGFEALPDFFWIGLDACNTPFLPEEVAVISRLEWRVIREEVLLAMPGLDSETLNTLNTTLEFLKIGVELGLNPYQMAILFCKIQDIDTIFVRQCYQEACALPGEFSENIQLVIRKYLVPCASLITDPANASFLVVQNEGAYGYKIPLMCVILKSLEETVEVSSAKEGRRDMDEALDLKQSDMPLEGVFMEILQDRMDSLKRSFSV